MLCLFPSLVSTKIWRLNGAQILRTFVGKYHNTAVEVVRPRGRAGFSFPDSKELYQLESVPKLVIYSEGIERNKNDVHSG